MIMIKNEITSALVMSSIVAVLVWMNSRQKDDTPGRSFAIFIKAFLIAFFVTFLLFYFLSDPGTDEVIDNIIKGKPDF
jgi:hypothetical protein